MRQFFNKDVNYSILLNLKKKIYSHLQKKKISKHKLNQAHKFDFFNVKKNKNGKEGTFVIA